MKQYIIIGCGRFGRALGTTLIELGQEVMVVDGDEEIIQSVSDVFTNAAIVDVSDERALRSIGLGNFDVAVVAIGSDIRASIMATIIAKELGVKTIISKAVDPIQAKVLEKIGASRVIFPEKDMGARLGRSLVSDHILDYLELDNESAIAEFKTPPSWIGKNILELDVRARYNINVIAVKLEGGFEVNIDPTLPLKHDSILVMIGKKHDMDKMAQLKA